MARFGKHPECQKHRKKLVGVKRKVCAECNYFYNRDWQQRMGRIKGTNINYSKLPEKIQCEICGSKIHKLVYDHNHEKGTFRGVLCIECNFVIGVLENKKISEGEFNVYIKKYQ